MTDLEITKLCGKAMGVRLRLAKAGEVKEWMIQADNGQIYDPLHDDAQAMALVKKFHLGLAWSGYWSAYEQGNGASGSNASINHAICEAVAKMQNAKPLP